jgi:pimeloyl-ACP methyl ester carboxylesterase
VPALEVDGHMLAYEDRGRGPLLLLVHGSPGSARAWQRVIDRLVDGHRVVALDLPGHGSTPALPDDAGRHIGRTAALIEALVGMVGQPAVLAGHSYGGVVALATALRGRVTPGALALLEPVAVPVLRLAGDDDAYARSRAVFDAYVAGVEAGDAGAVRTMVEFWFGAGAFERLPPPMQTFMVGAAPANARDVRATVLEVYDAATLARLAIPVRVLVGERSPEVTGRIARALAARVANGSVVPLASATHAMTTTHAEAVAEVLSGLAAGAP